MLKPLTAVILTTAAGGLAIAGIRITARRHLVAGTFDQSASPLSVTEGWPVQEADDTSELSPFAAAVVVRPPRVPAARAVPAQPR